MTLTASAVVALIASGAWAAPQQCTPPPIAIRDFRLLSLGQSEANAQKELTELLTSELSQKPIITVVERESLDPILKELDIAENAGSNSSARSGEAWPAEYFLEGSISGNAGMLEIEYSMLDIRTRRRSPLGKITVARGRLIEAAVGIAGSVASYMRNATPACGNEPLATGGSVVALIPFRDLEGNSGGLADAVSDLVVSAFVGTKGIVFVERARLDAILDELGLQQGGLIDQSSAVRVGKLLGANRVILGNLGVMNNIVTVNARAIDVNTGGVTGSVEETDGGGKILMLASRLTAKLSPFLGARGGVVPYDGADELMSARQRESERYVADARALLRRSYTPSSDGQAFERVVKNLKRAIYINPWQAEAYLRLYDCLSRMGRYAEAKTALATLIARYPAIIVPPADLAQAYLYLGYLDRAQGEYSAAILNFKKTAELRRSEGVDRQIQKMIGECQYLSGDYRGALATFMLLTRGSPLDQDYVNIPFIHELLGQPETALNQYQRIGGANAVVADGLGPEVTRKVSDRIDLLKSCLPPCDTKPLNDLAQAEILIIRRDQQAHNPEGAYWPGNQMERRSIPTLSRPDDLYEARLRLNRIISDYPRHPAAARASALLAYCNADGSVSGNDNVGNNGMQTIMGQPQSKNARSSSWPGDPIKQKAEHLRWLRDDPDNLRELYYMGTLEYGAFHNEKQAERYLTHFLSLSLENSSNRQALIGSVQEARRILDEIHKVQRTPEQIVDEWIAKDEFSQAGDELTRQQKYPEALWAYTKAYEEQRRRMDPVPQVSAHALMRMAGTYEKMDMWFEAKSIYGRLVREGIESARDVAVSAQKRIDWIESNFPNDSPLDERTAMVKNVAAELDKRYGFKSNAVYSRAR